MNEITYTKSSLKDSFLEKFDHDEEEEKQYIMLNEMIRENTQRKQLNRKISEEDLEIDLSKAKVDYKKLYTDKVRNRQWESFVDQQLDELSLKENDSEIANFIDVFQTVFEEKFQSLDEATRDFQSKVIILEIASYFFSEDPHLFHIINLSPIVDNVPLYLVKFCLRRGLPFKLFCYLLQNVSQLFAYFSLRGYVLRPWFTGDSKQQLGTKGEFLALKYKPLLIQSITEFCFADIPSEVMIINMKTIYKKNHRDDLQDEDYNKTISTAKRVQEYFTNFYAKKRKPELVESVRWTASFVELFIDFAGSYNKNEINSRIFTIPYMRTNETKFKDWNDITMLPKALTIEQIQDMRRRFHLAFLPTEQNQNEVTDTLELEQVSQPLRTTKITPERLGIENLPFSILLNSKPGDGGADEKDCDDHKSLYQDCKYIVKIGKEKFSSERLTALEHLYVKKYQSQEGKLKTSSVKRNSQSHQVRIPVNQKQQIFSLVLLLNAKTVTELMNRSLSKKNIKKMAEYITTSLSGSISFDQEKDIFNHTDSLLSDLCQRNKPITLIDFAMSLYSDDNMCAWFSCLENSKNIISMECLSVPYIGRQVVIPTQILCLLIPIAHDLFHRLSFFSDFKSLLSAVHDDPPRMRKVFNALIQDDISLLKTEKEVETYLSNLSLGFLILQWEYYLFHKYLKHFLKPKKHDLSFLIFLEKIEQCM
jgi:hypothetical protein